MYTNAASANNDLVPVVHRQLKACARDYITETRIRMMLGMTNGDVHQTCLMALGYVIQTLKLHLMHDTDREDETRAVLQSCQQQMRQLSQPMPQTSLMQ